MLLKYSLLPLLLSGADGRKVATKVTELAMTIEEQYQQRIDAMSSRSESLGRLLFI